MQAVKAVGQSSAKLTFAKCHPHLGHHMGRVGRPAGTVAFDLGFPNFGMSPEYHFDRIGEIEFKIEIADLAVANHLGPHAGCLSFPRRCGTTDREYPRKNDSSAGA